MLKLTFINGEHNSYKEVNKIFVSKIKLEVLYTYLSIEVKHYRKISNY